MQETIAPAEAAVDLRSIAFDGRRVVLERGRIGAPPRGQARIRAEWTQVSIGTEIAWLREHPGERVALGYSLVGIIDAVGEGVAWRVGQRVLSASLHAGAAHAPADGLVAVPDGVDAADAAIGILASVAMHIAQRAAPKLLEPAAVIGQGVVGALVLQLLRAGGAEPLFAVDADPARLRLARAVGAHAIDASREDVDAAVRAATGGAGVALAVEAATSAAGFATALKILALRGRLVATSTIYQPVAVRVVEDLVERELTILGAHQPKCPTAPNPYHAWTQLGNRAGALRAIADGRLRLDGLVSHRVTPDEAPALYDRLLAGDRSIVGALIDWRGG